MAFGRKKNGGAQPRRTAPHTSLDEYHCEAPCATHTDRSNPLDPKRCDCRDYWRTMKAAMHA